ncbi:MAG: glucose-6-phosphate dehydrogenase assembly protein OpcA [Luteolibacter sp.]
MSTDTIPAVCPELGIEVPVSQIEKELHKLWEKDDARTNASLINFAVYSERHGGILENSAILRDLTREHACRALLIEVDRSVTEPSLRAWITAHCHLSQGRKSVCCEQVAFRLTGRVTGRFRNTIFAHLNSDLPLVFWWQGELSDVFSERLVAVIDRLIVDSSSWKDPRSSFETMIGNAKWNDDLIIQDLAWTRTWQYRVGVASLFDDPVAQAALPEIDTVNLTYRPGNRNSALQLIAWLTVQAGWTPVSQSGSPLSFRAKNGNTISLHLTADENSAPIGKLELHSRNAILRVACDAGSTHLVREIEADQYKVSSHSPADPDTPAELLALQLSRGGKNSLYQKILPRFLELL